MISTFSNRMGECLRVHNAAVRREAKLHLRQKLKVMVAMKDEKKIMPKASTTSPASVTASSNTSVPKKRKNKSRTAQRAKAAVAKTQYNDLASKVQAVLGETFDSIEQKTNEKKTETVSRLTNMFRHNLLSYNNQLL